MHLLVEFGRRTLHWLVIAAAVCTAQAGDESTRSEFEARVADATRRGLLALARESPPNARIFERYDLALRSIVFHTSYDSQRAAADAAHEELRRAVAKDWDLSEPTRWGQWSELSATCIAFARRRTLVRSGIIREAPRDAADERTLSDLARRLSADMVLSDGLRYDRLWLGSRYAAEFSVFSGVLALHEAAQAGVRIDDDVWTRALRCLLDGRVEIEGGTSRAWPDLVTTGPGPMRARVTPTSVCGGIAAVAICLAHVDPKSATSLRAESVDAILAAQRWLGGRLSMVSDRFRGGTAPVPDTCTLLVTMEGLRALGVEHVGGRNWYREGAELLMALQRADGAFLGGGTRGSLEPHCLMFLLRWTRPLVSPHLPTFTSEGAPPAGYDPRRAALGDAATVLAMKWSQTSRSGLDTDPVLAEAGRLGPAVLEPLVARVAENDETEGTAAADMLPRLLDNALCAELPEALKTPCTPDTASRRARAAAWHDWLRKSGGHLVRDDASHRIARR